MALEFSFTDASGDYKVSIKHKDGSFETLSVSEKELNELSKQYDISPFVRRDNRTYKLGSPKEIQKGDRLSLSPKEESQK